MLVPRLQTRKTVSKRQRVMSSWDEAEDLILRPQRTAMAKRLPTRPTTNMARDVIPVSHQRQEERT